MKRYLKFVTPFISVLVLFMLVCFKTIPAGKLWKGYNILYVPVETEDSMVKDLLEDFEITEYFDLSGQYLPLLFSAYSPEITMLKLNSSESIFQYLTKRKAFFYDKSNKFRLYYVDSGYKSQLNDCVKLLTRQGIKAGVDGSASYPFLIPVISFIFFCILLVASKHKSVFAAGSFFLLVYIYCNPFYSCAVALCLFMLCIFFYSSLWNRKGGLLRLAGNFAVPVLLFFAIGGAFAGSVKSGFMFILSATGSVCAIYNLYYVQKFFISKRSFVPVAIRPAKRVSVYGGKANLILISSICSVLFLLGISFLNLDTSVNSKFSKLLLPSSEAGNSELVTLEDYYDFVWNVSSYPYKNLNTNSAQNYFEYPRYEQVDGKIQESVLIKAYNDSFKTETYESIDMLQFNAVEKLLKTQGSEVKPGYASCGSYHTGIFAIIMMFASLTVLLFIYISSMIRKGVRK